MRTRGSWLPGPSWRPPPRASALGVATGLSGRDHLGPSSLADSSIVNVKTYCVLQSTHQITSRHWFNFQNSFLLRFTDKKTEARDQLLRLVTQPWRWPCGLRLLTPARSQDNPAQTQGKREERMESASLGGSLRQGPQDPHAPPTPLWVGDGWVLALAS